MLHEILPLSDLLKQLLAPKLPLILRMGYLRVFTEGYVDTGRPARGLLDAWEMPLILKQLKSDLSDKSLYSVDSALQPNGRKYIYQHVVPTVGAFIKELWGPKLVQMRDEEEAGGMPADRTSKRASGRDASKNEFEDHISYIAALMTDLVRLVLDVLPVRQLILPA